MDIHIRRGRRTDYAALAALCSWPRDEQRPQRSLPLFRRTVSDLAYDLYVADHLGEPVGVVAVSYVRELGLGGQRATLEELLVHPECGCASQAMAFGNERTHILSTEGMINFAKQSPKPRFMVATEIGIIHRLEKEAPGKRFEPVNRKAFCKYMKMITLEKLRDSLRDWKHVVTVEPEIAARARGAIERMVALG